MATGEERPSSSIGELCARIQKLVPKSLGEETWYLIIAAVLVASPDPTRIRDLYTELTDPTRTSSSSSSSVFEKAQLSLRLRDVLMKEWTIIGIPPVVTAVAALARAEGDVDAASESSALSEKWAKPPAPSAIASRGHATLLSIYGETLLPKIMSSWGQHRADFEHMETSILYGQFLSDYSVLDAVESETVVLSSILCTGFPSPGIWHLRGLGRLLGAKRGQGDDGGAVVRDVEMVREAVAACVRWCGSEMVGRTRLDEWPAVADMMSKLGGFGG